MKNIASSVLKVLQFIFSGCPTIIRPYSAMGLPENNVVLTFDDGPNERSGVTTKILGVLKKYEIKAYFDVIGKQVEKNPEILRKIRDDGHVIVNHSYEHAMPLFQSKEELENEIDRSDLAIGAALGVPGYKSRFFQPPYGLVTDTLKEILQERKIQIVGLSVMPFPPDSESRSDNYRNVVRFYEKHLEKKRGGVIVLHDGRFRRAPAKEREETRSDGKTNREWVPDALEEIIVFFAGKGYTFDLLPSRA